MQMKQVFDSTFSEEKRLKYLPKYTELEIFFSDRLLLAAP